jgi:hypothetical protein
VNKKLPPLSVLAIIVCEPLRTICKFGTPPPTLLETFPPMLYVGAEVPA